MTCSECRIDPDLHGRIEAALAEYSTSETEKTDLVATALTRRIRPATRRRSRALAAAAALAAFVIGWLAFRPAEEMPAPTPSGTVVEQRAANVEALRGLGPDLKEHQGDWIVIAGGKLVGVSVDLKALLLMADKKAPGAAHRFVFRVGTEGNVEYETLVDRGAMAGMAFLTAADLKFWEDPKAGKGVFRYVDGRLRALLPVGAPGAGRPRPPVDFEVVTGFTGPLFLPDEFSRPRFEVPGRATVKMGSKSWDCRRFLVEVEVSARLHVVEAIGRLEAAPRPSVLFEWVKIPAGTFRFGEPGHTKEVELSTFEIMKYEVTNRQWLDYLKQEEQRLWRLDRFRDSVPRNWGWDPKSGKFPEVPDKLLGRPVVHITWSAANDFCRVYLPKKLKCPTVYLPTSEEWEKAARGSKDERRYPWGDHPGKIRDGGLVPLCNVRETGVRAPVDVTDYETDASYYGVHGMGGNVSEFVGFGPQNLSAIRGGSFDDPAVDAQVHFETRITPGSGTTFTYRNVGFRAVRPVNE